MTSEHLTRPSAQGSQHEIKSENVKYIFNRDVQCQHLFWLQNVFSWILFRTDGGPGDVFCNTLKK